jgi:hypothetical protein
MSAKGHKVIIPDLPRRFHIETKDTAQPGGL